MNNSLLQKPLLILFTLLMVGCQSNPNKIDTADAESITAEAAMMEWSQLQQSTLNHLREQNYGEATVTIKKMMTVAGDDIEKWELIRMALVSMPNDLALDLIEQALKKPFVVNSLEQQFAFTRVLTQMQAEARALELLNQIIKEDKQTDYVYWRARLYLMSKQEELAEADYQWLLQQEPKNTDYLSQYSTLLSFLGRDDEAMELLKGNEDDVDLLFRQIILLMQNDEQELAVSKLQKIKQLESETELTTEQKLEIGELAYWLEEYDYSLKLLQSVKAGEHINKAKLLMANVLVEQEHYDRAAVMYHQVQNGPEEHAIPAYQLEIELYREQGNTEAAMNTANTALRMFKDDPDILYSRAMLNAALDNIPALEKDLLKILQNDPENPDAMNALGYSWADNDMNLEQAYDYIMQAHEQKPEDKAILDSVGWIYYKKGDLEKAEHYLRLAIEDNVRDVESYRHLIKVLQEKGDLAAVEAISKTAKELFPKEAF